MLRFLRRLFGSRAKPETLISSGYDAEEMQAAQARARSELDRFLKELAAPTGSDHAVKAPISDKHGTEHFWLIELTYQDGVFEGTVNNDPGIVRCVKCGQRWRVAKDEISDWLFMRDGKMHGNYTLLPLLADMPPEEVAMYRAMLADSGL